VKTAARSEKRGVSAARTTTRFPVEVNPFPFGKSLAIRWVVAIFRRERAWQDDDR